VARRLSALLTRDRVAAIPSGWTVSTPTGSTVVCRTYDELVSVVSTRSGLSAAEVTAAGLDTAPLSRT
jgi:hypothetical protein